MKIGIISSLFFILNIWSGIIFFMNPPSGGSPPSDNKEVENNNSPVGVILIFLRDERCVKFFMEHKEKTKTFFMI